MRLVYLLAVLTLFAARTVTASISSTMLVEMREITSVSVSPDGQLAVIEICHSNPRTDSRETSWTVIPLRGGGAPITVPAGEEIYETAGGSGTLLRQQALWSSDGKWFFYLRRDGEEVQLWKTRADGRMSRQLTHSASDLIDLKRSSDPNLFIVQLATERAALRKAEEDEYRNGILYDGHIVGGWPLTRAVPMIDRPRSIRWRNVKGTETGEFAVLGWNAPTTAVFDVRLGKLSTGAVAIPTTFAAAASESALGRATVIALDPMPRRAYDYDGRYTLQLTPKVDGGPVQNCEIAECIARRLAIIGWSPDGTELYYQADSLQGPHGSGYRGGAALYAWNPRASVVRLIHDFGSEGLWGRFYNLGGPIGLTFEASPFAGGEVIAAFAGVDQPSRLEAINLDTGASRILLDPNAELRSMTQGRAVWQTWETPMGYSGRGMMILPDDYQPGKRYPAVITTYGCGNGFLRGGSGDNAPEFVLAGEGFIAICLEVKVGEITTREEAAGRDLTRLYQISCDMMSSLIADQSSKGRVDPTRVGLTGQSYGANMGTYCISHSNAIAAAAFRHAGTPDSTDWEVFDTSYWERSAGGMYARLHLPDPRNDPTGLWDQMSPSRRVRQINTPTLLQLEDQEYLRALPFRSAMREAGKAIEVYVFPDDTHMLMRPSHKLVNFERQVDWFKFWLKHEEDAAPSKRDQYNRWEELRASTSPSASEH